MESGVHSSLHPDCYHQIVFAKIHLKICYRLPYERQIWRYERQMLAVFVDHPINSLGITDFST